MSEIRGSVDIRRPVEEVFAYLSEPKNNLQWETGVVEMELTTEGPLAVGSKGRRVEKQMGTDEGTWEITEHVPNESLSMTFESQRFTGSGGYKLEAANGGTRLNYWFMGNPRKTLFKLLVPLMMPMIRRQVRKDYARLRVSLSLVHKRQALGSPRHLLSESRSTWNSSARRRLATSDTGHR